MSNLDIQRRTLVSHSEHSIVERPDVPRSRFKTQWTRKQSMNAGLVVPFMWEEVLPGDMLRWNVTAFMRMSTPLFPMFSNVKGDIFFFFVPNRLVWSEWERFMGEQANPTDSVDVVHPAADLTSPTDADVGSLWDYLGVPPSLAPAQTVRVNSLPARGYYLIWNEWFRDQNLQNSVTINTGSGISNPGNVLMPRGKFHDYFTTALPWTQKFANPAVPLSGIAPIRGIGFAVDRTAGSFGVTETLNNTTGQAATYTGAWPSNAAGVWFRAEPGPLRVPAIYADLTQATGVTINQLRQSIQIQRLLERDARGGTRYAELVLAHFGVRPPDYRIQRPEYLGGGSGMINITPVAQTATGGNGLGSIGAAGTGVIRAQASVASTEHGIVLGLISLRPEQVYFQGIRKSFLRATRYDYYFPALAQLGEQAITRQEIYATGVDAEDTTIFGYQERWAEYRQRYSDAAGLMRPGVVNSLGAWNLAQNFGTAPVLGDTFIRADQTAFDRVLALGATARTQGQQFIADILVEGDYVRPLPMFGTPVGLGRF